MTRTELVAEIERRFAAIKEVDGGADPEAVEREAASQAVGKAEPEAEAADGASGRSCHR
jgi:hypothetical protein